MPEEKAVIKQRLLDDPKNAVLRGQRWHPETGGVEIELSAEEREAVIDEWVEAEYAQQIVTETETQERTLRQQVRAHLATLDANVERLNQGIAVLTGPNPMTAAQLRSALAEVAGMTLDLTQGQRRMIRVLIDRSIIEPDDSA